MWWRAMLLGMLLLAGCDSGKLETGYEPNKLDMSMSQRKALYAEPFSPDSDNGGTDFGPSMAHQPGKM